MRNDLKPQADAGPQASIIAATPFVAARTERTST